MKLDLGDLGVDQEQQYRPGVAGGGYFRTLWGGGVLLGPWNT